MADMFGTSGKNGRNTGIWTANYATGAADQMGANSDNALNASLGQLADARQTYQGAQNNALGAVNTGYNDAKGYLSNIPGMFQPYQQNGAQASGMLNNAFGLNGAAGNQTATDTFQAGPGYQWQKSQAEDTAIRNASKLGLTGSGNTLTALSTLGSNLANQSWGDWLNRLTGQQTAGLQGATGAASGYTSLANLANTNGLAQAGLYGQYANSLAGLDTATANLYNNDASNRNDLEKWKAGQIIPAGQAAFKAGDQAAQNRGNLTMQGIQLGTSLLGGFLGTPTNGATVGSKLLGY